MTDERTPATTASRTLTEYDAMRGTLMTMKAQYEIVLGKTTNPDSFIRKALTTIQRNPALLRADRASLHNAIMKAAEANVEIDGKQSALVVHGNEVVFYPMVRGIIKVLGECDEAYKVTAHVVYEGDEFECELGFVNNVTHKVNFRGTRGKRLCVYATAEAKDGTRYLEPLSIDDVEAIRKQSKAPNSLGWTSFWDEMAEKAAIHRMEKRMPTSERVRALMDAYEADFDMGKGPERNITPKPAAPPPGQQLREMIGAGDYPAKNDEPTRTRRGRPPKTEPAAPKVEPPKTRAVNITNHTRQQSEQPPMIEVMREAIAQQISQRGDAFEMPAQFSGWQDSQDEALISATVDWLAALDG